jgi:transcription elongation factor Elf1
MYNEYEKQLLNHMDQLKKQALECIACPTCGSQWFVEVKANRYQVNHHVILGQDVPPEPNTISYILLRCVRCDDLLQPRVLHNTRDVAGDRYDDFLDTLEGKKDNRAKGQQKLQSNEISTQEL